MEDLISIIIPVYKVEKYIYKCILFAKIIAETTENMI